MLKKKELICNKAFTAWIIWLEFHLLGFRKKENVVFFEKAGKGDSFHERTTECSSTNFSGKTPKRTHSPWHS
jgi:hypothetical protein